MLNASGIRAVEPGREKMDAINQAISLTPTRPEEFGVPAGVLHVFESFGCGGFLLDRERQLLFLNPTAVDCLNDGLMLRGRRLAATDHDSDMQLQCLIGTALNSTDRAHGSASVWVRRESGLPLALHLVRLEDNARPALKGASLLLVAFDPERFQPPPPDTLTHLFGLTPAEAGVAIGIVGGRPLAQIASDRGVKVGTVRAYSKIVFGKTGTRGQAELAALLTRLAFLVPRRHGKRALMEFGLARRRSD